MRASSIALVLLVGCADTGDEGMFILNNTAPTGTSCMLTSTPGQPFLTAGTLEANTGHGYLLTPLIESRIDNPMMQGATRTIHLEGANITLSAVNSTGGLSTVSSFTSLISGSIDPLGAVNVAFEVLPASVATTPGEFSAHVTVFGTLGGSRIDGQPFDYPIRVCTGCVVRSIAAACPVTGMPVTGNPCNAFQDGPVDCCMNSGTLVCPATTM
jgi:hypothetical protein